MSDTNSIMVPGDKALAELDRLRAEYPRTGLYPVLFGDQEDFDIVKENQELSGQDRTSPKALVDESLKLSAPEWLRRRVEDDPGYYEVPHGSWPHVADPPMGVVTHLELRSGRPKPSVHIGLIPLGTPWHVFAHLGWGGWNACPFAAEHCMMHRYWQEKYGAEVVSITGAIVQCVVSRPPKGRDAGLELAHEQYIYCADIVQQGTETIEALAASLIGAPYWYFWWD